jgi:hypothetical protein
MPPHGRRQLDDASRTRLIRYLKAASRPADDDERLDYAAQLGMAQEQTKTGRDPSRL